MTITIARRVPRSTPTTVDIDQIPALQRKDELADILPFPMAAGDLIAVRTIDYRGQLTSYARNFILGSVVEYAERYREDAEAAVAKARAAGHSLYYVITEATVISSRIIEKGPRIELELGSILQMDGQCFQLLQAPNDNLTLVPLPTA
jgi:hypothetical protein